MGLANVLKPTVPLALSESIMSEEELSTRALDNGSTIGTNPETVCIALESIYTDERRREALKQLTQISGSDQSKRNRNHK